MAKKSTKTKTVKAKTESSAAVNENPKDIIINKDRIAIRLVFEPADNEYGEVVKEIAGFFKFQNDYEEFKASSQFFELVNNCKTHYDFEVFNGLFDKEIFGEQVHFGCLCKFIYWIEKGIITQDDIRIADIVKTRIAEFRKKITWIKVLGTESENDA